MVTEDNDPEWIARTTVQGSSQGENGMSEQLVPFDILLLFANAHKPCSTHFHFVAASHLLKEVPWVIAEACVKATGTWGKCH